MLRNQSLSIRALMDKSKENFKAANYLANEAFGKSFFAGIATFSSSLWPVPFALGWLGFRFGHLDFDLLFSMPLLGDSLNYTAVFLLIYILTRILAAKLRKRFLPQPKTGSDQEEEKYYTWADLHDPKNLSNSSPEPAKKAETA